MRPIVLLLLSFCLLPAAAAQDQSVAFVGGTVYPVTGPRIEAGTVVVSGGEIIAVGPVESVGVPAGARIVDTTGRVVMPGLVDTHSHVGDGDGGDSSGPLHPEVRILDTLDPRADSFWRARAGGITTVNVMPGSGHLMSGQTAYLKLRNANTIEGMLICNDPLTEICGGMKMANGTNSIRSAAGSFPNTRARSVALVRDLFMDAIAYREKRAKDEAGTPRDLRYEPVLEILDGRRIVHFHTHRHDDVLSALRIGREFGFTPVLHHVSEGWRVADEIAAAGAMASIIVLDSPGGKLEARELLPSTGSVLEAAGVDFAYHTDDGITDSRLFLRSAALGIRAGMSREKALESMTIAGARMLGMADRIGSLEIGKDADIIVLSGDPFSVYTHIDQTWVDGEQVFDLSDPNQRPYAMGGYNIYRAGSMHLHEEDGD